MYWKCILFLLLTLLVAASSSMAQPTKQTDPLKEFEKRAAKFNSVVTLPQFETTTNEIGANLRHTIAVGNAALDRIGALNPPDVTFDNTVRALDDLGHQISLTGDRFGLLKETSTNAALRDAATDALKELQEWTVGIDYREDVYQALKAYADEKPKLEGEDAKLLAETMRDYRRAGLDLPKPQRDEVERMRKELTRLKTDYEYNITKAEKAVKFTKAELEGVPENFLAQTKTGDDEYTVMANVTWHYLSVMDNARREDTRKRLLVGPRKPRPRR